MHYPIDFLRKQLALLCAKNGIVLDIVFLFQDNKLCQEIKCHKCFVLRNCLRLLPDDLCQNSQYHPTDT